MFERYTESARRAIFFARYEASQLCSQCIEVEHLLLGILRQGRRSRHLPHLNYEQIRAEVEKTPNVIDAVASKRQISTSVDLPVSNEGKRVLGYAAEEAERLSSKNIELEHLVLGLLREPTEAARILKDHGCEASKIRESVGAGWTEQSGAQGFNAPQSHEAARIHFVDVDSGNEIDDMALFAFFPIPRVGESVILSVHTEPVLFRVIEVTYDFSGAKPKAVWVRVARRQSAHRSGAPTDST